jgi:integrase
MIFADPARGVRPGRFPLRPVLGLDAPARADLLAGATRADHRLLLLLAGVHALSRTEITGLRIDDVDLAARRLRVRGRWVILDQPTCQ